MANWKKGDEVWRGYARTYGVDHNRWWPEIRPAVISDVNADGTLHVRMCGPIPSLGDTRAMRGCWVSYRLPAANVFRTPEQALRHAKLIAADANAVGRKVVVGMISNIERVVVNRKRAA